MKDQSQVAIQFSGYPLTVADPKQKSHKPNLVAIKAKTNHQPTSVEDNTITNDPKNWDLNWFNGYE